MAKTHAKQEFEGYMKNTVLTNRRLKWYFEIEVPQMNLENQIYQPFETPAAGKPINPY